MEDVMQNKRTNPLRNSIIPNAVTDYFLGKYEADKENKPPHSIPEKKVSVTTIFRYRDGYNRPVRYTVMI